MSYIDKFPDSKSGIGFYQDKTKLEKNKTVREGKKPAAHTHTRHTHKWLYRARWGEGSERVQERETLLGGKKRRKNGAIFCAKIFPPL